jgi:hypothetical protein
MISPTHASTVSHALIAASSEPVCPTMSPLAKLTTITSRSRRRRAAEHGVATP